ncbi:AAA family ATPase, partial [Pseudorhodoplanes sp.]|uniref:AAA family ATPase n=1 Tax=Pseudorhodoplanes sp. TaxID=1934341 RepID=UPI00391C71EE
MLVRLSIRDIVLIDKLDLDFAKGLAVLTGETGAGKSILLDAFALALGARGDAGLVRQGAAQGQVTAEFDVPAKHPARTFLKQQGIEADDDLILRRIQSVDGKTRAFVNDQPVSVQTLRSLGAALVEIHGQHDDRALVDAATHRTLLDAYAGLEDDAADVARLYEARRQAAEAVETHRADVERAEREADYLRHAVAELSKLAPKAGEETTLAERRAAMMQAEKIAGDLQDAYEAVTGNASPVP